MSNDQPAFDPMDEQTSPTQFVPEPLEMIDVLTITEAEYPLHVELKFDPLELGDADDLSDNDPGLEATFDVFEREETGVVSMELPATPAGYTAPQFDRFDSPADINQDLDALFAEQADSASGQSANIAVWCPWLVDAAQG